MNTLQMVLNMTFTLHDSLCQVSPLSACQPAEWLQRWRCVPNGRKDDQVWRTKAPCPFAIELSHSWASHLLETSTKIAVFCFDWHQDCSCDLSWSSSIWFFFGSINSYCPTLSCNGTRNQRWHHACQVCGHFEGLQSQLFGGRQDGGQGPFPVGSLSTKTIFSAPSDESTWQIWAAKYFGTLPPLKVETYIISLQLVSICNSQTEYIILSDLTGVDLGLDSSWLLFSKIFHVLFRNTNNVPTKTSAMHNTHASLLPVLRSTPPGTASNWWTTGNRNANVFPDPVGARSITSRFPVKARGTARDWMGVQSVKFKYSNCLRSDSWSFKDWNFISEMIPPWSFSALPLVDPPVFCFFDALESPGDFVFRFPLAISTDLAGVVSGLLRLPMASDFGGFRFFFCFLEAFRISPVPLETESVSTSFWKRFFLQSFTLEA